MGTASKTGSLFSTLTNEMSQKSPPERVHMYGEDLRVPSSVAFPGGLLVSAARDPSS